MQHEEPAARTKQLTALTSIRFFAALHILLYHLFEANRMTREQGSGIALEIFDALPQPVINWLRHGYFSTSLFFLISGFILAYLYIQSDGAMSRTKRHFWIARATRVYPLHLLLLLIAAPFVLIAALLGQADLFDVVVSGLLSAGLLQAWFPPYALSWNFPTWALSTVAFFYLSFPYLVRLLRSWSRRRLATLLACLPLISLLPSVVYLTIHPAGGEPNSFWHEFVMRTPLFWIPHFLMGIVLARVWGMNRYEESWRDRVDSRFPWGDLAFSVVLVISLFDISIPDFVLRHGLLAPLYMVVVYDLAKGRGVLSRLLTSPSLKSLGDASFSIFMLQFPVMILGVILSGPLRVPSSLVVTLIVVIAVVLSLLSTNYFEKPLSQILRRRLGAL